MIQVRCEGCQSTFDLDERRIPKSGMRVRCPRCGASFQISPTGVTSVAAGPPASRSGTLIFGNADNLPAPVVPGVTDLPAPARPGGVADLPAPAAARSVADLPAPAAARSVADLPAVQKSVTDLPAPAAPRGVTDLPTAARPVVDLPATAQGRADLPAPWPVAAPGPVDLFSLDEPAPVAPSSPVAPAAAKPVLTDALDDPFAQGAPEAQLPVAKPPAADLPMTAPRGDLPASSKLGRVALEKRAVPVSALGEAGLPIAASSAGLPVTAPVAGLPTRAGGAGLPVPASGAGLPMAAAAGLPVASPHESGLPVVASGSALPAPASRDLGFGELELPLSDEPVPSTAPRQSRVTETAGRGRAPSTPPGAPGSEFDLPLPPPPDDAARAPNRHAGGGMGFGEISLGDDAPAPAAGDVGEFDQIPLERTGPGMDPSGVDALLPPRAPAPAVSIAARAPATPAAMKPAPPRKGLYVTLGAVAAIVIGGAALSMTPAGPFGANLIDEKLNGPARHAAAQRAIDAARASLEQDSYGRARSALRALDAQLAQTPGERELAAFDAFAHYVVLARFGNDSAVAGRARTLFDGLTAVPAGTPYVALARAARELVTGHPERARRAPASDPLGRDLVTLALLEGSDPAEALEAARAGVQRHPTPRSRFLHAWALFLTDDRAGARREAEALVQAVPGHASARLLLAKILSDRAETRERAVALAHEVEGMTRDASPDERTEAAVLIGQTELLRDRVTAAREAFERALALDPRSPQALVGAATILYRQGNYAEAHARFLAAQTADPEDLDARVGLAMTSVALNRPAEAREGLEPLLSQHGGDARVHYWLARALNAMNERAAAEREFREAIRLDNTNLEAYTALAALLFAMQRPEAAEQVLGDARAHVSDQAAIHRALGEGRLARGDVEGAEAELRQAVAIRGDDIRTHAALAQVYRRLRRFDEAQREIDAVARLDPEYPGLLLERGQLAEARGAAADAVATFRAALARDPQNPELIVRVAAALVANGQYADADAQLSRFIVEHPNMAEAQYVLGRARLAQGNITDAVRLLEHATELDATRAEFHAYAAQANLERAQFARALEHANRAIEIDRTYARGFWVRGEVKVRQGAVREALLDANEALRLDPGFAEASVTLADADEALGHVPEAIEMYRRALTQQPGRGEWHARLGRLLADQGREAEAITALERAVSLGDPVNPPPVWLAPAHRQLGDLLRGRDRARARHHYQRFLDLSPSTGAGVADVRAALAELGR
jgi:predicted Zn finger-like uncharacterized protein